MPCEFGRPRNLTAVLVRRLRPTIQIGLDALDVLNTSTKAQFVQSVEHKTEGLNERGWVGLGCSVGSGERSCGHVTQSSIVGRGGIASHLKAYSLILLRTHAKTRANPRRRPALSRLSLVIETMDVVVWPTPFS